jgi:hypothetical protein
MRSYANAGALYEYLWGEAKGLWQQSTIQNDCISTLPEKKQSTYIVFKLLQRCVSRCGWWLSLFVCRARALRLGHGVNLIGAIRFAWSD